MVPIAFHAPRSTLAALVAFGVALILSASAVVGAACTPVSGPFVNTLTTGPGCTSPVLMCTHGELEGDLEGDYDFRMTSMLPAPTPEHPTRFAFTGESIITLANGKMFAADLGELDYGLLGPSPFRTVVNIHSGDGALQGVTGQLVATGELDFTTGVGSGVYEGEICGA